MQNNTQKNKEARRDRFVRVATRRTNDILNRIRILGNCSNKSAYDYTDDDIKRIFSAIDAEIKIAKAKFGNTSTRSFCLEL